MTQSASEPLPPPRHYPRARILMALATVVSLALFTGASRMLGLPAAAGQTVSLLQQSAPILPLVVILVLLVVSAFVGSFVAGSVRRDAGLVAACLGLVAITFRGGTISATLHAAASASVYSSLAVELVLLYAFILLAHLALAPLRSSGHLLDDHHHDGVMSPADEPIGNKLLATAAQTLGTLILLLLLAQSPDKMQALGSVFVASLLAAAAAHSAFPVAPSIFFWVGPGLVGVIGYAYAAASPGPWLIGLPANPLVAPLPLDYAAAGPAGAIMGYWMSRRWQQAREATVTSNDDGPAMTEAHMPVG